MMKAKKNRVKRNNPGKQLFRDQRGQIAVLSSQKLTRNTHIRNPNIEN